MSATEELIQTVYEFRGLLRYLGENYPNILTQWKNKSAGVYETPAAPNTDADTNSSFGKQRGDDIP